MGFEGWVGSVETRSRGRGERGWVFGFLFGIRGSGDRSRVFFIKRRFVFRFSFDLFGFRRSVLVVLE